MSEIKLYDTVEFQGLPYMVTQIDEQSDRLLLRITAESCFWAPRNECELVLILQLE